VGLFRLPLIIVDSLICGEDNERLTVEIGEGRRVMYRRARHAILPWDEARKVAGGRRVSARLVPAAWRQTAVGELGDQASGSEVGDCRYQRDARPPTL
jgi:hypothetical protein